MITPHKPIAKFDFLEAVTLAFRVEGGTKFGFRLWFWMSLGLAVTYFISLPLLLPHYGEMLAINQNNVQEILAGGSPDDSRLLDAFKPMLPSYLIMMFGIWGTWVAGETALYRKTLRGEEAPKQPLRLGRDEGRVFLSQLGVFGLIMLAYTLGIAGVIFLAALFSNMSMVLGVLVTFIGIIAVMCFIINLSVTLAPAAPLSIRRQAVHVLAARKVVKHRFWEMFGAYLTVFILGYIVIYLVMYIGIVALTGNGDFIMAMSGFGTEDPSVLLEGIAERLKNPVIMLIAVLAQIIYAAVFALWIIMLTGIGAYAVKWWEADSQV